MLGVESPALPDDQWTREVMKWFQTALANIQYRIVDFPNNFWAANGTIAGDWKTTGNTDYGVVAAKNWQESFAPALEGLCEQQLVRSTDQYQSFLLVGVLIVVVVSVVLIVVSWTLEMCVRRRGSRREGGKKRHKLLAYVADGKTQLLHEVLKGAGHGGWENEFDAVPSRRPADADRERDISPVREQQGRKAIRYFGPSVGNPPSERADSSERAPEEEKVQSVNEALLADQERAAA